MADDKRHLQLRLSHQQRRELEETSRRLGMTAADVIRGSLFFGMPVLTALMEVRSEVLRRFISILKKEARSETTGVS